MRAFLDEKHRGTQFQADESGDDQHERGEEHEPAEGEEDVEEALDHGSAARAPQHKVDLLVRGLHSTRSISLTATSFSKVSSYRSEYLISPGQSSG